MAGLCNLKDEPMIKLSALGASFHSRPTSSVKLLTMNRSIDIKYDSDMSRALGAIPEQPCRQDNNSLHV